MSEIQCFNIGNDHDLASDVIPAPLTGIRSKDTQIQYGRALYATSIFSSKFLNDC